MRTFVCMDRYEKQIDIVRQSVSQSVTHNCLCLPSQSHDSIEFSSNSPFHQFEILIKLDKLKTHGPNPFMYTQPQPLSAFNTVYRRLCCSKRGTM